jgi:hypothetical protein
MLLSKKAELRDKTNILISPKLFNGETNEAVHFKNDPHSLKIMYMFILDIPTRKP